MIGLALAAFASTETGFELAMPGEAFPEFVIEEHCRAMAVSSSSKIRHLSKTCISQEVNDRPLAEEQWKLASEGDRMMCEIHALNAVGSYEVLASCLVAQNAIQIFLDAPKRNTK